MLAKTNIRIRRQEWNMKFYWCFGCKSRIRDNNPKIRPHYINHSSAKPFHFEHFFRFLLKRKDVYEKTRLCLIKKKPQGKEESDSNDERGQLSNHFLKKVFFFMFLCMRIDKLLFFKQVLWLNLTRFTWFSIWEKEIIEYHEKKSFFCDKWVSWALKVVETLI